MGTATRVYISLALIATALIFAPRGPVFWGLVAGGVLAYFLFPVVIQGLLAPLERRVLAARRSEATGLLQEVRTRRVVRQFAPHAWLTLQEGRLHLRRGDGKAAARAFTETVRLSRGADAPGLISAQAHALLLADQPEQTRELLQQLAKKHPLSPTDHLHLGLAMLASKGRGPEALEQVRAAEAGLGPHPRVLAALALALHRNDEAVPALEALQRAQEALGSEADPFDEALIQRGTKLLRTVQKAQQKRERKPTQAQVQAQIPTLAAPRVATGVAVAPPGPDSKAKSPRKVKKEERRSARRTAKAEKRVQGVEPVKVKKVGKSVTKGVAEAKPVKGVAKVEGAKAEAKPVETRPVAEVQTATKPVAEIKPAVETKPAVEMKAETKPAVETKPVAEVKPAVETKPVAETKPAVAAAPGPEARSVAPALAPVPEARPVVAETPVPEARSVELVPVPEARPIVATPRPVMPPPRPDVMRVPAPPAGATLFGSVTPGAPRPSGAAAPPVLGLPRAPVSSPVLNAMFAPPPIASAPPLRPPMVQSSSTAPWGGMPPPTLSRTLPPIASAPVLLPRPASAPVPRAPGAIVPTGPSPVPPPTAPSLAQALPDTDDGWDDMLDALEADAPGAPR